MRLLATADLHYNNPRSRRLADDLIDQINSRADYDALLLVGDTASGGGDELEQCLARFSFAGPKLFVAGNHELWTHGDDSYVLFRRELPRRVAAAGWHWLQTRPFVRDRVAIVGSIGWYDYSFAPQRLQIPRRFYESKVSPGAAEHYGLHHLLERADDVPAQARKIYARWNDGKFVKLHRSDEAFLEELLDELDQQLRSLKDLPQIVAAVHHLPFAELLPPPASAQWDFAKAYLGSARVGECLLRHENVRMVLCGHSHLPGEAMVGQIHAINIGASYRAKTFRLLDLG